MFADRTRRDDDEEEEDVYAVSCHPLPAPVPLPKDEEGRASLVKRSEIDFSWRRGGRMMCTSGSGHRGSWIDVTTDAARTCTGIDWVMVVSRS